MNRFLYILMIGIKNLKVKINGIAREKKSRYMSYLYNLEMYEEQ